MNEPWIANIGLVGAILGAMIGLFGAIIGTLTGVCVSRGKARKLTLGITALALVLSFISLIVGIIAILSGQPYRVWECFGDIGIFGIVLFGSGFWVIRKKFTDIELRKFLSEDLTLAVDKDGKKFNTPS